MTAPSVAIRDGDCSALIALHGGELVSWRVGDTELIWTPDPTVWDRASPILFPVVGWCRDAKIRVGNVSYPMGVHGFAAHCRFEIAQRHPSRVTLLLRDSVATRAHYPFAFELAVTYALAGNSLSIDLKVRNAGEDALPYACGVHPGFRWPFAGGAREDYRIEFEMAERPGVPVIAPGGLFSNEVRPTGMNGNVLPVNDDTFAHEALCFLDARSSSLAMISGDGQRVSAAFEKFPHIALWSRPGAPFLCLEAWTGYGDPVGFSGELVNKPSMILLKPEQEGRHAATFTLGHRSVALHPRSSRASPGS